MATANKVADATTEGEDTRAGGEGNETVPVVLQGEEPGACRTSSMLVASDSFEDLELCVGKPNDKGNVSDASSEGGVFRERVPSGPIDEITRLDGLALSNDVQPSTDSSNGTIPSGELTTEVDTVFPMHTFQIRKTCTAKPKEPVGSSSSAGFPCSKRAHHANWDVFIGPHNS